MIIKKLKKQILFVVTFNLLVNGLAFGQGKVCIPESIVNKKIHGVVYLNNGDSIVGKFTYLTPLNDIHTTHILYQSKNGEKRSINRLEIIAYKNKKEAYKRYKAYPNIDSVFVKKGCRFDMGIFMTAIVDGAYKLLSNKLKSDATIQAYNQSYTKEVYYLLTPNNVLLALSRNDLKPQLQSLFSDYEETALIFDEPEFDINKAATLIEIVNESIAAN